MSQAVVGSSIEERKSRRRVLISSYIGSVIEWFDFYLYGTAAAIVFNVIFFPQFSALAGLLASFAILGAGFLARPVGGIIWGHYGDRIGRKKMLVLSIMLMGVATVGIGLLPTYAQIGILAPIILVVLRLVQGLAAGGEWGGAALMTLEHAKTNRRGLWSSVAQMGVGSGILLAAFVFSIISRLPEDAFLAWGWRLPFLGAGVLIVVGLWIRLGVEESPVFKEAQEKQAAKAGVREERPPALELLKNQWRTLCLAIMIVIGPFTTSAVFITFGAAYAVQLGFEASQATTGLLVAQIAALTCVPLAAGISDYIGRRPVYMAGAVMLGISSFIIFTLFNTLSVPLLVLGITIAYATHSFMYGPMAAFLAELFATGNRYTGASIGYQGAAAIGGGFGPLIATSLLVFGGGPPNTLYVSIFMALTCVVSFVGAYLVKETYRIDLNRITEEAVVSNVVSTDGGQQTSTPSKSVN